MSNQKDIFNLIKHLTGQANILTIPRLFVAYTGSLDAALLLSQIIYWSDKTKNEEGWFFKSYKDWENEICLTKHKTNKAINILTSLGIVKTKVKKANGNPTLHFKFIEESFIDRFSVFLTNESKKIELSSYIDYKHRLKERDFNAEYDEMDRADLIKAGLTYTQSRI